MKYIESSNLPKNIVKAAIVDCKAGEEIAELNNLGISIIKTLEIPNFDKPISTHPDMQICHIGGTEFFTFNNTAVYYKKKIKEVGNNELCENFNNRYTYINKENKVEYPFDCLLNSAISKQWVIAHKDTTIYDGLEKNIIKTRQGYAKCSTCIIDDNAIITADLGIAKSAGNFGIDVCIVTNDSIRLQGYKNGFIGGSCGKISKDTIAFFGNIKTHPDADKIVSFCRNHGVECISLSNNTLYDYGSLLPILEE